MKQCSEGCSGHGICGYNMLDFNTGEPLARCLCESGYAGEFCEVALECKDSCSGRGECVNGHCICSCGYTGEACERVALASDACPKDCFGGGDCIMGQCFCHPGREGALCEKVKACPGNENKPCSGNGVCKYGTKLFVVVGKKKSSYVSFAPVDFKSCQFNVACSSFQITTLTSEISRL